jgi:F0F1-type ATP synthase assembly protein I
MARGDALRRLSARGLLCQAGVGAMVALVAAVWGRYAGWSALGGAAVAWVTNLYMYSRALVLERSLGAALQRVLVGELIKVAATIALFVAAARMPHVVWPALLGGYAAARVASWLALAVPADAEVDGARAAGCAIEPGKAGRVGI